VCALIALASILFGSFPAHAQTDSDYQQAHPRLAFRRIDVPGLRAKLRDGGADDAAYAAIRTSVTSIYPTATLSQLMNISYGMNVPLDCGLVAFVDDSANQAARDTGRHFTLALADSFAAGDDPFYTSIRLRCLCYGYDLCMDDATPAERVYVRGEIESYVDSLMVAFNFERWLHPPYVSNKTAMTGAALGIAAVCLADEEPPSWVNAAIARADTFVATWMRYHLDPDGTCFEGVQYGTWAMRHLAWYFEARRRYDGFDYSQRTDFRGLERWLAYEALPENGGVVNNLNDTSYLNHPIEYVLNGLARWNSGSAEWLWDECSALRIRRGRGRDRAATALRHRSVAPSTWAADCRARFWKRAGTGYFVRAGRAQRFR
jgi:hypothetical protein